MSPIDISFCWTFAGQSPVDGLARLREYGFEGIELWPQFLDQHGAERWARSLRETDMRCFQLCPYFDFVHGEQKIEQSRRILEQYLVAAEVLGCRRLRVFTGPPWGEGVVGAAAATDEEWTAATSGLRHFCDAAGPDVELCLECHEGSLMENSASTLRLIDGVNRPNLTVNLQLPLLDEPTDVSLATLAPYTRHIHIHNWNSAGDLTFLDSGMFDWLPVMRRILGHGHRLCLSVEHPDHGGRDDPWETARRDGAYLQALRETANPER